jgi:hypothetical protein
MRKLFSFLVCSLLFLVAPAIVFAATPQQVLDKALASANVSQASEKNLTGKIDWQLTPASSRYKDRATKGHAEIVFQMSAFPRTATSTDRDIKLQVPVLRITDAKGAQSVSTSIGLNFRTIGGVLYTQISSLPTNLAEQAGAFGIDAAMIVGKWIRVDGQEVTQALGQGLSLPGGSSFSFSAGEGDPSALLSVLSTKNALRVSRVEKKWKDTKTGHNMMRMRVTINPAWITALQQNMVKQIPKNDPDRKTKTKEIQKNITDLRTLARSLVLVVNVNATDFVITRLEGDAKLTQPSYESVWQNNKTKQVLIGKETIHVVFGLDNRIVADRAVEVPAESTSLMDLFAQLFQSGASSIEEEMTSSTMPVVPGL